uniref:ADP-ribosylation factor-like protein 15 n=1 Tax=Gongylonema pulchrum TaxID=637853 RepID=A0A183EYK5_9BILA
LANLLQLPDFPATVPVVLLANKQDLPEACRIVEIKQFLTSEVIRKRLSTTVSCCAVTGDGLDGLFAEIHQLIVQSRNGNGS